MTPAQIEAMMDWVKACIDEKIQDAFGRDGLQESIRERELRDEVYMAFRYSVSSSGRPYYEDK